MMVNLKIANGLAHGPL